MKYTAAHWGSYSFDPQLVDPQLKPLPNDPDPSEIGAGWVDGAFDPGVRIARPAIRKGWLENRDRNRNGDDAFVEVDWDEALDLAASEITRIRSEHGNNAIFAGSYGWASAGRFHHAQSQLRRFMNLAGGYVGARATYSHAAAEIIFPYLTGFSNAKLQEDMTSWPLIAENCELLLSFGGVSGRTAQISSSGTSIHEVPHWLGRAVDNGMKVIGVTPVQSDLCDLPGAEWVPIRPGTDVALMLALAFEIRAMGKHDQAFLDRYTDGWDIFETYLTGAADGVPKSADWAAPICDVPAPRIREIAERLAGTRNMISLAWGLQRADHGEQSVWAGLTLAAMLGQIGQAGTGFGFGYGSVTPVGRPKRFINWPSVSQGTNPITDVIPVARIADALLDPGGSYQFDGETRQYPDLRMVYWAGGNPYHHHQDLFRLEQAWERPETIIVHDHSWTSTVRRADIVLPSNSPLERHDIMMNRRDPSLIYMSPLRSSFAQSRSDHEIFAGIAQRLGCADSFTEGRSEVEWLRWLWEESRKRAQYQSFELPEFDDFREMGNFEIPEPDATRILFEDFVQDPDKNRLRTESGRLQIHSKRIAGFDLPDCKGHPTWFPPIEGEEQVQAGGFHLISPQPMSRLHGQLDSGSVSRAAKITGREACKIHPDCAARLGISAGDIVLLENDRGACLAGAELDDGIREDCVSLPTGAWFDPQVVDGKRLDVHGNPNVLTIDKGTSLLTQGNIAHTAVVFLRKWDGPVPEISVHKPPVLLSRT